MDFLRRLFGSKTNSREQLTEDDLLRLLIKTSEPKKLYQLIDTYEELILQSFKGWKTVPVEYRKGTKAEKYVNRLVQIAAYFEKNGNTALMDILNLNEANEMFDRWHDTLDKAHDLIKENNNDKAIEILDKLLIELNTLSGSGTEKCKAVLYGRLGEAWLRKNNLAKANEFTMRAYEGCQEVGEIQGLIVFCLQLAEISKAKNNLNEEKHWQIVATNIMIQFSQKEEAIKLRKEFGITPLEELIDTYL